MIYAISVMYGPISLFVSKWQKVPTRAEELQPSFRGSEARNVFDGGRVKYLSDYKQGLGKL